MGKKKIAKKFAAVKRIISSQDDRMQQSLLFLEKQTNKNFNNNNVNVDNYYKSKHPTTFKSNKCRLYLISSSPK